MELSVVLPSYREEENLRVILPRLVRVLEALGVESEVIVVDTQAPRDRTREVCHELGVSCVSRRGGDDYGNAVRTGIAASRGRYVVFMDADGSSLPEFLPELYGRRGEADVIIASRYVAGGETEVEPILRWMSRILNFWYALILRLGCRDISNAFKLYPGEALRALSLNSVHFDVIEEILFKLSCREAGFQLKEVPVSFKNRIFGETKRDLPVFIISYIRTLVRLRLEPRQTPL